MSFSANQYGVRLPYFDETVDSVDVLFGENRVWSIDLKRPPRSIRGRFLWPPALKPYLIGKSRVSLRFSGKEEVLATTTAKFTNDDCVTQVVDHAGTPLAINKWGRLGKTLGEGALDVQGRLLDRTTEVIHALQHLGLQPFVVGGTLLGGVRSQALLPHDDDADIAYLSPFQFPADVAREGFKVGRALGRAGYEVVRHSATHMQVYFRDESGELDHYVDVFAAFFTDDGYLNQPFHVRGPLQRDQIIPFSSVNIQGYEFPAPADPEAWLVINYDDNWRTPIPGYRLATPRSTIRRFRNWFGSFHSSRDFWNEYYDNQAHEQDTRWETGAAWLLEQNRTLSSSWLLELGSGAGKLALDLVNSSSRSVIATDYSPAALKAAATRDPDRLLVEHLNLYRNLSLAVPKQAGVDGPFDIVANHLLDQVTSHALPQAMRLFRMALRSGGKVLATLNARADYSLPRHDPTSWCRSSNEIRTLARKFGMLTETVPIYRSKTDRRRKTYGVQFHLDTMSPSRSLDD